jgi:hypothetical protein
MEVRAVVPSLHDDFSTEAIFARENVGDPLEWTGALPPERLARRLTHQLPGSSTLTGLLEHGEPQW